VALTHLVPMILIIPVLLDDPTSDTLDNTIVLDKPADNDDDPISDNAIISSTNNSGDVPSHSGSHSLSSDDSADVHSHGGLLDDTCFISEDSSSIDFGFDEALAYLVTMGYPEAVCRIILPWFNNSITKSMDWLLDDKNALLIQSYQL